MISKQLTLGMGNASYLEVLRLLLLLPIAGPHLEWLACVNVCVREVFEWRVVNPVIEVLVCSSLTYSCSQLVVYSPNVKAKLLKLALHVPPKF